MGRWPRRCRRCPIRLEDVLAHVRLDGAARTFVASGTLRDARARFEREYIAAVLEHHRGPIGEAARELGIQRTNLYRKMRSLKVSWRGRNGNEYGGLTRSKSASVDALTKSLRRLSQSPTE